MKTTKFSLLTAGLLSLSLQGQVCDPTTAPTGLSATYTPGTGVLLQWDLKPGSRGVQIRADLPSGSPVEVRLGGFELSQFMIADASLTQGTYTWRVQAACSAVPPYDVTPVSESNTFTVGVVTTCPSTVMDIDQNVYGTVKIGNQCWTAENLKVERYRNGDSIPRCLNCSPTPNGFYALYENLESNKSVYGLLYSWYAVDDQRGLCPTGWHVPTDEEWTQMVAVLDPLSCGSCLVPEHSPEAGGQMKTTGTLEAGTGLWRDPNAGATNSSGFNGLPGGRMNADGGFFRQGYHGFWWSSSELSDVRALFRRLTYSSGILFLYDDNKRDAFSVRCVQD